ncbi:hypothetical protein AB6A40_006344 [Gnathostoma spinigerum]|uniref:DDHD domain-containing protein n=1 Tax=Gnathostoma spinigerum TaxID=75299 RepID=A0ABD6ETS1_9BILA
MQTTMVDTAEEVEKGEEVLSNPAKDDTNANSKSTSFTTTKPGVDPNENEDISKKGEGLTKHAASAPVLGETKECDKVPTVPPRNKKYRVTELKCTEVRWFYKKKNVDTKWTAFKGIDSVRLEVYWRERNGIPIDDSTRRRLESIAHSNVVVVLDGLYELTDDATAVTAVYWKDDRLEIRRGSWFLLESNQPIDPEMADAIEAHHLRYFRHQVVPDTPVFSEKESSKKPMLTELKLKDMYEVRWNSVIDITLYNNSRSSRLFRYITWGKGTSLKRGYEESELEDTTFSHLVLVVHGIGQKGYENLIAKNTEQVREAVYESIKRNYPDEKTRPMFLPIEWRAALTLDEGLTDKVTLPKMSSMRTMLNSTAMDIMYYQSPLYRNEIMRGLVRSLNNVYTKFTERNPEFNGPISLYAHSLGSVMCYDILTSWSPLVLYDKYVSETVEEHIRSPQSSSNVEVLLQFREARQQLDDTFGGIEKVFLRHDEELKFKVTNLFCIGSPLAVFLIMRGTREVYPESKMFDRIFNIFHPYDPVAYRLEPLRHESYRLIRAPKLYSALDPRSKDDYDIAPLEIHKSYMKKLKAKEKEEKEGPLSDGSSRTGQQETEDIEEEEECESEDESMTVRSNGSCSSPRSLTPMPQDVAGDNRRSWWRFGSSRKEPAELAKEVEERKLTETEKLLESIPEHQRLTRRLDFQVQPQITERSYWSVLKSHFSYWVNPDIAAFIANQLYSEEPRCRKGESPMSQ